MLYFGRGCLLTEIVYADSHYLVDIKDGSDQVHFREARSLRKDSKMADDLNRVRYTTQKVIKGSVLADHLAHHAVDDYQSMNFEFPDKNIMLVTNYEEPEPDEGHEKGSRWTMVFDGASNTLGNGIGAVIISHEGCHTPFTARLCFNCTNNMAEYEACIMGLKASINLRINFLDVFGDSTLVII